MHIYAVNITFGIRYSIDISLPCMLLPENLTEQAFTPPLSRITLQSGPQDQWSLPVQNACGITVGDLCAGIVALYYKPLDQNETYSLPSNIIARVRASASNRLQANPRSGDMLQRIDTLTGHTKIWAVQLSSDLTHCRVIMK